jgi:hypothetical protein
MAVPRKQNGVQVNNLKALAKKTDIPLIQLTDDLTVTIPDLGKPYSTLLTAEGVKSVAKYATCMGPYKNTLYGVDAKTNLLTKSTGVAELIHAAGMQVCARAAAAAQCILVITQRAPKGGAAALRALRACSHHASREPLLHRYSHQARG